MYFIIHIHLLLLTECVNMW